jgi:hypothetical protein
MAAYKTRSIPTFKAPRPGVAKPARMPSLKLPSMKTGGTPRMSMPSLPRAATGPRASVRSTPYSSRIAVAASSGSPSAIGTPPAGYRKQKNQAL